ncbi:hybrid sensor histidine kinase/response regulator [Pseudomonas profundi]|uniref:hybrid sensor histidine kinase/response regulator n=1 Tax=Pseudomonas profundi TaxID=1981513 RepID=UPI001681C123|nr:PAS domain S-box protein [Pseudomonas profundi]
MNSTVSISNQRLAQALEIQAIGVIYLDMTGRLVGANDAFLAATQYSRDELQSGQLTWQRLTPPEWIEASEKAFAELRSCGETTPYEKEYIRRDGSRWWALFVAKMLDDDIAFEFTIDITDRKLAEQALERSEQRLRSLINTIPQLVWRSAHTTDWVWTSEQWTKHTGLSSKQSKGKGWLAAVHPDDYARVIAGWHPCPNAQRAEFDCRIRNAESGTYRWFQGCATPVHSTSGELLEWVGTFTDIDDQVCSREALAQSRDLLEARVVERTSELQSALDELSVEVSERKQAEEKLVQSEKLKAIGQLTGGIAHDFNNLLAGISASLEIMQQRMASGRTENLERYSSMALTSVKRAAALTHRLLAFSRQQSLAPRSISPKQIIAELEELIRRTVGPHIRISCNFAAGGFVMCDPQQLENALLNLAINSRDAMPDGGTLTINTRHCRFDQRLADELSLQAGEYVCISVTDTGEGMDANVAAHAFDPFYTTKSIGDGTGLGLSMVYGFTQQSGGSTRIQSEPGLGTTVSMFFPSDTGPTPEARKQVQHALPEANGENILVVDDEAPVRVLVSEGLREQGYRVREAEDSESAYQLLAQDEAIDLLITDIGLPGAVNGRALAETFRSKLPGLKVLFITGFAADPQLEAAASLRSTALLTKPFAMVDMTERVHSLLTEED